MFNISFLLDDIVNNTGVDVSAFSSKSIETLPSIQYQLYKDGDDGAVESWRMQLRFTAERFIDAVDLQEQVIEMLTTVGDEEKYGATVIHLNGGGSIEDPMSGLPSLITYLSITSKS